MRGSFLGITILIAHVIAAAIFFTILPEFIRHGGPLVIVLIALSLIVVTLVIERLLSLKKAQGRESLPTFLRKVQQAVHNGDVDGAIALCDKQRGSLASVIASGLRRFKEVQGLDDRKAAMDEVKQAIEEATLLEVPILERNLVAMSTIASIATMVGLLGTVIGMIRAFSAFAGGGTPDAATLSTGISEALFNTAGGIFGAIIAIVSYNYFTTRVDTYTYMIDEASQTIVDALATQGSGKGSARPAMTTAAATSAAPTAPAR